MKTRRFSAVLASALVLAGCGGEPRFDGSSHEAGLASLDRMTAGLPADESRRLRAAVTILTIGDVAREKSPDDAVKPLDGLTASEIMARAKGRLDLEVPEMPDF